MTHKVLSSDQLPTRPPIVATIAYFTALKVFEAPAWLWGALITLTVLVWAVYVVQACKQQPTKIRELE